MKSTKYDSVRKMWSGNEDCSPLFHESVTLGRVAFFLLNLHPDRVCQTSADDGSSRTNGEIYRAAMKIAFHLQDRGCRKGDVVGFVCRNTHNLTPAVLASLFLSAPVNALDPAFLKDEVIHMFRTTRPKFVFCDDVSIRMVQKALLECQSKASIIILGEKVRNFVHIDEFLNDETHQMEIMKLSIHPPEVDQNTCGAIICSSGTTGPSKGVMLSHFSLQLMFYRPSLSFIVDSNDCFFSFSSLYWYSGWVAMFFSIFLGITRIITTETSSPETFISILRDYPVSMVINTPSHVAQLMYSPFMQEDTLANVKMLMCGGTLVTQELANRVRQHLPKGLFTVRYGMTEVGSISAQLMATTKASVGTLAAGAKAKILDEDGKNVGVGESGEIVVQTKSLFLGYYNNPKATKDILINGWVHTGDIGHFDEEGDLYITGRKKDTLKYCSYQIAPGELEELIEKHPGVLHAVVVGIPDHICVDLPAAVVVRKNGATVSEEEIAQFVEENVTDFKKLRGGVYFVNELPMTPSGKFKKLPIREMATQFYTEKNPVRL